MLYAFHRQQSARKPGSIHAIYLLVGVRTPAAPSVAVTVPVNGHQRERAKDGEDEVMQSSPFMSSAVQKGEENDDDDEEEMEERVKVKSVVLVREEDLDRMLP